MTEKTGSVVMDPATMERLLDHADDSVRALDGPTATLFNGQQIHLPLTGLAGANTSIDGMTLRPVVSDDRRSVRFTAVTTSKATGEATHHTVELSSGDTCAWEIGGLTESAKASRRSFVLITAEIVVAEEEEERIL
jgi:hypothetical protein